VILIDDPRSVQPDGAVALLDDPPVVTGGPSSGATSWSRSDRGVIASAIGRKFQGISAMTATGYLEKNIPCQLSRYQALMRRPP